MPKGFDEQEKHRIRNALVVKGRELFSHYGLKKTGIAELSRAAGIAQGSFYLFYNSKEELYFEILEKEEETIREKFLKEFFSSRPLTRKLFKQFLQAALDIFESNPLIRHALLEDNIEAILRKLPPEKKNLHTQRDTAVLLPLIQFWQNEGSMIERKPEAIAALIRSLFFLPLYKQEIGEEFYPDMLELMIDLIATGLIKE